MNCLNCGCFHEDDEPPREDPTPAPRAVLLDQARQRVRDARLDCEVCHTYQKPDVENYAAYARAYAEKQSAEAALAQLLTGEGAP